MLSLLLLLPIVACSSTFTCSVACEKDDVAACTWLARELHDRQAAARACALDDKACDELALLLVAYGRPQDASDVLARLAPKCERGDMATCKAILEHAWGAKRDSSPPSALALSMRGASRAYCAAVVPPLCPETDEYCRDWAEPLELCATAATGLNEPGISDGLWSRALAACRKNANACIDLLFVATERTRAATTTQDKAQQTKTLVEVAQSALPACKKPNDRGCRSLANLHLDDLPSLAKLVATKRCAVEGGEVCSEQDVRLCDGGKGPLTTCVDAVLGSGSDAFDDDGGVSKKLMEACIKDDARACFASGVIGVGRQSFYRQSLLTADEAFARACKLKDQRACRASVHPEAIVAPRTVPSDALHPSEQVAVQVRSRGKGAPIGSVYLVEDWTWTIGDDGEADHVRTVVNASEGRYRGDQRVELGGLNEGADVIVWDHAAGMMRRTVVLTNLQEKPASPK